MNCSNDTANDRRVHEAIVEATDRAHQVMEACLGEILDIEGWDRATMAIPEALKKKPAKSL